MDVAGTNSPLRSEPAEKSASSASEILPALTDTAFVPGWKRDSTTKRAAEEERSYYFLLEPMDEWSKTKPARLAKLFTS